jgi:ribosome-associated protein
MRGLDAAPIIEQLNELEKPSKRQTAIFHVAERWRQELVDDPENVERFVKEFPAADATRLRALAQAAKDEKRGARALRNFRELFHVLNAVLQEHARGAP